MKRKSPITEQKPFSPKSLNDLQEIGEQKRFKSDFSYFAHSMSDAFSEECRQDSLNEFLSKYNSNLNFKLYCKSNGLLKVIFHSIYNISQIDLTVVLVNELTLDEIIEEIDCFLSFAHKLVDSNPRVTVSFFVEAIIRRFSTKNNINELKRSLVPWFIQNIASINGVNKLEDSSYVAILLFFSDVEELLKFICDVFYEDSTLFHNSDYLHLLLNLTGNSTYCKYLSESNSFLNLFTFSLDSYDFYAFAALINLVEFSEKFRNELLGNHRDKLRSLARFLNEKTEISFSLASSFTRANSSECECTDSTRQIHLSIIAVFLGSFFLLDDDFDIESELEIKTCRLLDFVKSFVDINLVMGNNNLLWNESFKRVVSILSERYGLCGL